MTEMTPLKGPPAAAAAAFPSLDLKWSLTLRVVTVALLCFVIAAAITFVGTYREVRHANEAFADIVARQLQMQLLRIDANIDLRSRFPDWEPVTARAQTAG
jgi:dTDP-4-amino-4,6-dideoxygalactose transaminase